MKQELKFVQIIVESLGISSCIGAFIVLIFGIILCECLLVLENLGLSLLKCTNFLTT